MLTTEETTHHTTATGTFDAASRLCTAWQWLETQRQTAPEGADVWDIRWQAQRSATYLTDLLHTLQAGEYRLSPLQLHGQGDDRKAVWGAQDALVLKWVTLSIEEQLPLHPACEHVKGHGGGRQSIAKLHALLTGTPPEHAPEQTTEQTSKKTADHAWVCRTDIRGYYRNISKETLLNQVRQHVQDPVLTALIRQYIHYTVEDGGTFYTPEKGISRGCALSPLMGALHLYDMDEHFSRQRDIHYARYMDDIVILAHTRWSLRKHTKRLMQWFSEYGFEAHPDKTQIGRTAKGFDWMGAWLTHEGVTDIAPRAKANHREKVRRLYERIARVPDWLRHRRQQQVHARVSAYRKRWNIWAKSVTMGINTALRLRSYTASVGITVLLCNPVQALAGMQIEAGPPLVLPKGEQGDTIGSGTITFTNMTPNWGSATSFAISQIGWMPSSSGQTTTYEIVGGKAVIHVFDNCPSVVFRPESVTITGNGTWKASDVPSMTFTFTGTNSLVAINTAPASTLYSGSLYKYTPGIKVNGSWLYATRTADTAFKCSAVTTLSQQDFGLTYNSPAPAKPGTTTVVNGVTLSTTSAGGVNTGVITVQKGAASGTGSPSTPPVIPVSCSFANAVPPVNFPNDISPTDINKAANSKVIAKATSPISLSITCSGNMSGVQPVVELQWTKSAPLGGTGGLRIGVANDVADDSNGILLSTADSAVGAYGSCGTVPTGYDMCGAYYITPGTPLTLYPVVFRNTNTTDKARSGVHTVTGTLKVVVP